MTKDEIDKIPKVILHTHLEGSIPEITLNELSIRNNIQLSFNPFSKNIYESIQENNWDSFRKIYFEICSCFNSEKDFFDSLYSYGKKLSKQNVIYAEVQFSPWKHISRGVPIENISKGFISAIKELEKENITIRLICDLVRNKDEKCDYILDWLIELPREIFLSLGISGGSNAVPRYQYEKYCIKAKKHDLKITAHAGEIEGPDSVKDVIQYFHVDRIGHGIRIIEDQVLLNMLNEKQIHFEICPTANKIIGLCRNSFEPIMKIVSTGVNYSINTDDELIFDTDITEEILIALRNGIISSSDILENQKNALRNSFAISNLKSRLIHTYYA